MLNFNHIKDQIIYTINFKWLLPIQLYIIFEIDRWYFDLKLDS
jgi:hypothetical protein